MKSMKWKLALLATATAAIVAGCGGGGADSTSQRASAGSIIIDADYRLIPAQGGKPIARGVAFTFASYDRSSQRFANIRAARDAEIRDARALAEQIKTRLAADLVR